MPFGWLTQGAASWGTTRWKSGAAMKSLRVPPVWSHACSLTSVGCAAPSVYTTVPPTEVALVSAPG